jgi:CheY-like chemotaxis protein
MQIEKNSAPLNILVAEDDIVNRTLLSKIFDKLGYRATIAENGLEAYNAFDAQFYDIVFMDIEMPEMNGYEVTKKLRERFNGEARQPYIIALTAHSLGGEMEKYIQLGMNTYIAKPFTLVEVEKLLAEVIKGN